MPKERKSFFSYLDNGISFNHAVGLIYPKDYFKQGLKKYLSKLNLYKAK